MDTRFVTTVLRDDISPPDLTDDLKLLFGKLTECRRSCLKRCKERSLEEAFKILKERIQLQSLERSQLLSLVKLLVAMQMDAMDVSVLCRKLDQMVQFVGEMNSDIVFEEVQRHTNTIMHSDQIMSIRDLQLVSMFLESSTLGQGMFRQECHSLLAKIAEVFVSSQGGDDFRDEALCYQAVKVCLQIFQLLPKEVSPMVFGTEETNPVMSRILGFLMDILLGWSTNKDTRLLAGTAVAMLVNTAPNENAARMAALSLLHLTRTEPRQLTLGGLQVQCHCRAEDGLQRLALSRGLLTACRKDILAYGLDPRETCLLLDIFPVVAALCEDSLDDHYYAFQVFTLWLKCLKACLPSIWKMSSVPLMGQDSSLQCQVIEVIWNNAESPIEGITESVRSALCLFMEIYECDCRHHDDAERVLYRELLHRTIELPWETKAKYLFLCALLPYLGSGKVLENYAEFPAHLLKCLSINHLSPWACEFYKSFIQEQRRELCKMQPSPPSEFELASKWSQYWQATLLEALTSDVKLLQTNAVSHLLPWTLRTFPSASMMLMDPLDPTSQGHLRAWTCIMSCHRATCGGSSWISEGSHAFQTLQNALTSLDDGVRLAALNVLCCSPKSTEMPSALEFSALRNFIPLNLNSEAPAFRQQLYSAVKKFLCRVRDTCLAKVLKSKSKMGLALEDKNILCKGVEFVDWVAELAFLYLNPVSNYQRKRTVLLLLSAVLETCTDTWSPEKKKGQPPANISTLITWARSKGRWDFFSKSKQLVLINCLEDMTNEICELSAEVLVLYFPKFPDDVIPLVFRRAEHLLHSPRPQDSQTGALMMKVLLQMSENLSPAWRKSRVHGDGNITSLCQYLLQLIQQQYLTAKTDMLTASQTAPLHGAVTALQRCLLEVPGVLCKEMDDDMIRKTLSVMENMTVLLLGVLYGDQDTESKEVPPSFFEMGNAISCVIGQQLGSDDPGEEYVLLSEEHSLVLSCCWISLKEIGIFLGSLVERMVAGGPNKLDHSVTAHDMKRMAKLYKDIILKCRHWGAVEGCCRGFIKFCSTLLFSADPEVRDIPAQLLKEGLQLLQSPRGTSVTRRAAGLPMLFLCVVSAAESSQSRSLLPLSINTLLEVANGPLPDNWDQTLDLPQVCAVHTLNALVRGSSLGVAIQKYCSEMTTLALTLLNSCCWAVRNAALQLYSSLCTRMLGQSPGSVHASTQCGMCPLTFFTHYPSLLPFLLAQLRDAALDLQDSSQLRRLCVHPSLYPVLTLLAKLQPGLQTETRELSDAVTLLLQLASSPVYSIRVMASKALVAMMPCAKYTVYLIKLVEELPKSGEEPCFHNYLHGQLLQIRAILTQVLHTDKTALNSLRLFVEVLESKIWLVTSGQKCLLIRVFYLDVVCLVRSCCSKGFLHQLCALLLSELHTSPHHTQVGSDSFHEAVVYFLCEDPSWVCLVWQRFSSWSAALKLPLLRWASEGGGSSMTDIQPLLEKTLQVNLKDVLLNEDTEIRGVYLKALVSVMAGGVGGLVLEETAIQECAEILVRSLEVSDGGSEYRSRALCAISLLLSESLDWTLCPRWCSLLERHMVPHASEALRLACAESLCLAGGPLMRKDQKDNVHKPDLSLRLINTGLWLLQDQSEHVRVKAAVFVSKVRNPTPRGRGRQQSSFLIHVNQSMLMLLDLLLEEFWDHSGILEVLLSHLPESDFSSVLKDTKESKFSSLYERDDANVYVEPLAVSESLLPYLLQLAGRYSESSTLAQRLDHWVKDHLAQVLENLTVCKKIVSGLQSLESSWLSFLSDPLFHTNLCGLFARAIFLNQLLISGELHPLCDSTTLSRDLLDVHRQLCMNGVFLPQIFPDAVMRLLEKSNIQVV
ncbi:thyroid adenoma-associated protein homolog isoform X2 [Clupea harengus]|uniref:Thyroid adenoma-associated protein homolog isoform X2 n=1 Tax=Clupea harengus TaxID=7950 RepID=A0A6P8FBJ5_CLUHA|nr:thyroid adenoma-associated protein homolog isoform X2 [Clupea harengus]